MGLADFAFAPGTLEGNLGTHEDHLPELIRARSARTSLITETLMVLGRLQDVLAEATPEGCSVGTITGTDSASSPLSQTDEEYWQGNEGLTCERQFHTKLYYLVNMLGAAYQQSDIDGMCDAVRRMLWVDERVVDEPLQSIYVTGLVLGLLNVAHACSDHYMIADGYVIAEHCAELLKAKRERRAAAGLFQKPDSECWYTLYGLVAELKWKGIENDRARLLSPEQIIAEFESVEKRSLDYLAANPSADPSRNKRIKRNLAWNRLQLIKMAFRWLPEKVDPLISRFNEIHNSGLSPEVGHFQRPQPGHRDDPWYWDLELFKWCAKGPASVDEALLCHQWRLDAMRSRRTPDGSLAAYERSTVREVESLMNLNTISEVYADS